MNMECKQVNNDTKDVLPCEEDTDDDCNEEDESEIRYGSNH